MQCRVAQAQTCIIATAGIRPRTPRVVDTLITPVGQFGGGCTGLKSLTVQTAKSVDKT